jgi:transcriptional regulator with XRE-family HTH domain
MDDWPFNRGSQPPHHAHENAHEQVEADAVVKAATVQDVASEHWRELQLLAVRSAELSVARHEVRWSPVLPNIDLQPPSGWRHPVTGRKQLQPDPRLVRFGRYVRRARHIAGMSQQRLADISGVSQPTVSRLERGLTPSMGVDKLAALAEVFGRSLPLGFCPHDHDCPWQPDSRRWSQQSAIERLVQAMDDARGSHDTGPAIQGDE